MSGITEDEIDFEVEGEDEDALTDEDRAAMEKAAAFLDNVPRYSDLDDDDGEEEEETLEADPAEDPEEEEEEEVLEADPADPAEDPDGEEEEEEGEEEETLEGVDDDLKDQPIDVQKLVMDERNKSRDLEETLTADNQKHAARNEVLQHNSQITTDRANYGAVIAIGDGYAGDLETLESKLKVALEEGDTDAQVDLGKKIRGVESNLSKIADAKAQYVNAYGEDDKGDIKFPELKAEDEITSKANKDNGFDPNKLPPEAKLWYMKNQTAIENTHKIPISDILEIDLMVNKLGKDPTTPDYYDTINRLIKEKYPNAELAGSREVEKAKEDPAPKKKSKPKLSGKKSPVAKVKSTSASQSSSSKVVLTAENFRTMRTFGMDPTNPKDQKAMAKSILEGRKSE